MAEAEAADETDQTPASPPGLGFSSPALHAAAQVAMIAAHGDELEDGAGELDSGDALQLELDADEEEGAPRGNGGDADQVGADTEPAALDGGDGAVPCFGSPPSSPSPAVVLCGEESSAISSNASSPQAGPGLGRRLLGAIGLASPSKPHGVIHRAKLGLGLVLHPKGDQEEGAAHHRDTKEEEMVHKCSDANWSTTHDASALEGQVEEESTVGEINAERGANVDDTDAKGQQLVDQDTSDQCKQTDEVIDVGEELVLEGGLGDKWGPTNNALTVEDWEKPVKQDECAANGNDIALEGQEKEAEQRTSDELGVTMHDSAVEDQVMVELEGAVDKQGATKDGITVEDQEKAVKQCTSGELGATMDDNVVEDQEKVEPEGAVHKQGDITLEDKGKAMEQCAGDKSTATNDENAVEEKEKVVEQEDMLDKQVTIKDGNAVEYQEEVVEQGVICEQSAIGDDIARDDQEKVVHQRTSDGLRSTMDGNAVGDQEVVEQDVIDERGGTTDGIVVEDQEKVVEQCATDELGATENGDAVEDQEVVEQGVIPEMGETTYDIAVEDKEKAMEQCTTDELGATENDDAVEDQEVAEQGVITEMGATMDDNVVEDHEVAEQGVITEMGATMDDNVVEDHEVVEQSVIDERGGTTDSIAAEDQEKAVEQCAVHKSRAAKDEKAVEEKEKVVEHGVIDKQGAMPVVDIAADDQEKAVEQYFSDELVTNKDENAVEEHKKVAEQGVIDGSGGTKDDIYVEEQENVKEQGIIDKWDTANDGTTLEDQKKAAELCIGDEQRAIKDVVAVRNQENMLQQSIIDERGATKGEFTVENRKEVVERVRHEWGATEDDLAVDTAASGGVSGISSSDVVSVSINGSDGKTVKKEKVKLCVRYPQRPGKLNCPFYMSTGCYSYGLSCHFNHPPLKANSDVSSVSSEQGNHGVAEILELNRVGLPIREGARNCTFYMQNGTCRYGKKCHYNHPEQVIDAQFYPPTGWEDNVLPSSPHLKKSSDHATLDDTSYLKKSSDDATLDDTSYSKRSSDHATLDGTSYSKKSSDHATLDNTSSSSEVLPPNILRMLLPPQKVPPSTEGKVMKVKKDPDWSSASDDSDGCCSADSSDGPLCKQGHVDYPERPGRPECPFYMRFGDCKFASACKYHHSKDRFPCRYHLKDPLLGEELIEYPERPGEPECPFYMKSRFCKFGAECKFHHPKDLTPSRRNPTTTKKSVAAANEHHPAIRITLKDHICPQQQHPERPGQPDCRYYMQFGKCKYLSACIFHHPKDRLPSGWHPSDPAHSDQYDTWQPTNRIEDLRQQAQIGPEVPGMPECPFYMKTGTCQFGSACEFRHPKDRCSTTEEAIDQGTDLAYDNFTRSDNVPQQQEQTMYPERPGEPECSYYMRHGSCKFRMNCKYHHPRDRLSKKPDHFVSTLRLSRADVTTATCLV